MHTSRSAAAVLVAALLSAGSTGLARANQSASVKSIETIAMRQGDIAVRVPKANSKVKPPFEFAGRTQPRAVVTIEASTSDNSGDGNAKATFNKQTRADERGHFSVEVAVANARKYVRVHARSVAPDGAEAQTTQLFAVAQ